MPQRHSPREEKIILGGREEKTGERERLKVKVKAIVSRLYQRRDADAVHVRLALAF